MPLPLSQALRERGRKGNQREKGLWQAPIHCKSAVQLKDGYSINREPLNLLSSEQSCANPEGQSLICSK